MIYNMFVYVYIHICIFMCIYICMDGVVGLLLCCRGCLAGWCDVPNSALECFLPFDLLLSSAANSQRCVEAATAFILMRIRCSLLLRRPFSVYIIPYPPKTLTLKSLFPFILYHTPPKKKNSILTTDSNNPKPPVLHLKSAVAGQLPATNMVSLLPVDIRGKRL